MPFTCQWAVPAGRTHRAMSMPKHLEGPYEFGAWLGVRQGKSGFDLGAQIGTHGVLSRAVLKGKKEKKLQASGQEVP